MADVTEQQLRTIIASVFSVDPSVIVDTLRPGEIPAWDSLGHLSLIGALEQAFATTLTMEESLAINSIADVKAVLAKHGVRIVPASS